MRATLFLLASTQVSGDVRVARRSQAFLASDMQPQVVAHTLLRVEDEWRSQAAAFAECNATLTDASDTTECNGAPDSFQKSCSTVVSAVVQASNGDRQVVSEYMSDICGEAELSGWHQERCGELASAVHESMLDDNYENRENFNAGSLCSKFWARFAAEEKTRVDQERAEREAEEKKAEEERIAAEKKAAEEAAEAEKKRQKEEAEAKAVEAKRQAEEAAAQLKAKKEEAERQAEEAKKKMEEAKVAAEEAAAHHRQLLANLSSVNASTVRVNSTQSIAQNSTAVAVPVNQTVNATK